MLTLLRSSRPAWRGAVAPRYAFSVRRAAPYSTAFRPSRMVMVEDKDVDPTPDKARGGSEQSMPGEASGDQIADSDAAYDGSTPRPDDSGKEMEGEKDVNMQRSAASSQPAKSATDGESKQTSSQGKGGSKPGASGGSAVRGGNAN